MTKLLHILGSDIPHHNQTVLRFFNDKLAAETTLAHRFMVVAGAGFTPEAYPALDITVYPGKSALAKALVAFARQHPDDGLFFHGQFNTGVWLALLRGGLKPARVSWHIWGADLYEVSSSLKFRLFYLIRRIAQGRVGRVFATRGDLDYYHQRHPVVPGQLLYFPTRMDPQLNTLADSITRQGPLTILVGNSGDRSNNHIAALQAVHRQFGDTVNVVVPMGYPANNQAYIDEVEQAGRGLFSTGHLRVLREQMPFAEYLQLLRTCDLGWLTFERQQGIGTLCLLIQAGIPCVLSRKNPFWKDMVAEQLPVLFEGDVLSEQIIRQAQRQLSCVDKQHIAFFNPGYLAGWHDALRLAAGGRP
ncbi:TDP-N-acetylfucosamine:lipid II N-acetylfucosaminyltransferase [Shimwellia blattae]|uniref:TDP-N-acetylfucosamine:lipid II N-acetylfucosaminyltransferase n=1 Tax=Shimwellia blattae (strain ATCC 29907 / DSM 4481 / JCM 1650 / NBRC 105725 / CDC 9005-74) TaxID=630626 RepID=I2BE73_SHIBC|nr:TDP-N-acetylfucosamine:lipid II N-acetylfucosaminyltransferase [Shimwellia blattae]AFJ48827.1 4-alpha-L-fucosyltransferase [Shimwellia blattae DSM 4481 = NBRC 105725]GAB82595.1 4-alpha-L-fucosyltransferase [Shimwellia blattae DSM 4481 = NBRC 105725]VDY66312.1 4-alpha-L-fucosyltransferase [Shimwellia blattae]VEC27761.1 4-alpha-L-fucosyltransferase [Shimwellia blattae]